MKDPAQDHLFLCNSILAFEFNNQGRIKIMQIYRHLCLPFAFPHVLNSELRPRCLAFYKP